MKSVSNVHSKATLPGKLLVQQVSATYFNKLHRTTLGKPLSVIPLSWKAGMGGGAEVGVEAGESFAHPSSWIFEGHTITIKTTPFSVALSGY